MFASIAFAVPLMLGVAHAQLESPLSTPTSDAVTPGEIVFADLVTTDVERAAEFYNAVFGWELRRTNDAGYVELVHSGELIGAIAAFEEDAEPGSARWLPSVSVLDVDATASSVVAMGGTIIEPPAEFPDRGRLAVVSDTEGAVLMLLRSSSGDPPRSPGGFGWAELWSSNVAKAVQFYEGVFGYRALRSANSDAPPTVVLTTGGSARATIVSLPGDNVDPNWVPYGEVDDAPRTLEEIRRHGGAVLATSDDVEGDVGSFAAIIADPTGGVFAIQVREVDP